MVNRRSLGDALTMTPDKMAFIQGANAQVESVKAIPPQPLAVAPEPIQEVPEAEERGDDLPEESLTTRPEATSRMQTRRSRGRSSRPERERQDDSIMLGMANLLVPLTTRLQPPTAAALKRAGLEQRLRGAQPATVQQIVEIAVAEWLEQHDYL